jgi:hypothetical protein
MDSAGTSAKVVVSSLWLDLNGVKPVFSGHRPDATLRCAQLLQRFPARLKPDNTWRYFKNSARKTPVCNEESKETDWRNHFLWR